MTPSGSTAISHRVPHPAVFAILCAPFGVTVGFVSVALSFLATKSGLTVEQGAMLIAVSAFPQVWKFFWAPLGDITLTRHRWYIISVLLCAGGIAFNASVPLGPQTLFLTEVIILLTAVAATLLGFAVEGMLAHLTPPEERGRYCGWYQAGNLGGTGIGGGVGLWLLTHLASRWQAGLILGALVLACSALLLFVPSIPAESRGVAVTAAIRNVWVDLWGSLRTRVGLLTALLCFVPVGTGAASGVLAQAEIAAYWKAGPDEVSLVQGFLAGLFTMIGSVIGGYGCNRLGSRTAYAVYGGVMALVAAVMAYLPMTPAVYLWGNLAYAFVTGFTYAAFSAIVLDAIGAGNAATKYNAFASISNTPIWYMGLVLAAAETHFGPRGLLMCESLFGVAGIAVFLAVVAIPIRPKPALASA